MDSIPYVILRILDFIFHSIFFPSLLFIIKHNTTILWACLCAYGFYRAFRLVFKIKVEVHPATRAVFKDMVTRFQRESMFSPDDEVPEGIPIHEDVDLVSDPTHKDIKRVRASRRVSYAVRVAHVAKSKVGLLANTKANELVYSRLCRDEMVTHGVRPSHIAHAVPLAVAACFIPLDSDFLAASIRNCQEMEERRAVLGPSYGKGGLLCTSGFTTPTWRGNPEGLLVKRGPPLAKPRKLYRFSGFGTHIRYGVHDHSLGNVRRGLVERLFMVETKDGLAPTPKPTPGVYAKLSRFHDLVSANLTSTTRLTYEQFLGFYSGRKLERYQQAVESLAIRPIGVQDAWLSTFVKAEKLNISAKPDPAPRVIQPRSPRYNVEVGRFLRHAEEHLFDAINRVYGGRTVFKGLNADQAGMEMQAMWQEFDNPVGIGMDASRFDQHVSKEALEFEHKIWLSMYHGSDRKTLAKLLGMQIHNRGLARCPDGEIRYTVEGCRMSGDINTSSGNCYIMCATVHNYCSRLGVKRFRLANNGDDCMLVVEAKDEARVRQGLIEYYRELGFTMKVEPTVYELEHLEFCQTRPVLVDGAYRMVRNLHQGMSKDLHSLHDLGSRKAAEAWVSAVGSGGRVMNDGVPVLKSFFMQFPLSAAPKTKSDMSIALQEDWKYKFNRTGCFRNLAPTPQSRYSFWRAFGVLPDEQIALENGFSRLSFDKLDQDIQEEVSLLQFSGA
uniref:RNA-directed RNA polymerase n=1 Tax=Beet black scorch virus TaxID=196375 RepID=D1GV54_9TOMB|nr:RNA-dependent RNA polymerase, p82 [Beet black scorch virus]